jgi:hypothetical protein
MGERLNDESIQRPRIIKQEESSKRNDVQILANIIRTEEIEDFKLNLTDPFDPIEIRKCKIHTSLNCFREFSILMLFYLVHEVKEELNRETN